MQRKAYWTTLDGSPCFLNRRALLARAAGPAKRLKGDTLASPRLASPQLASPRGLEHLERAAAELLRRAAWLRKQRDSHIATRELTFKVRKITPLLHVRHLRCALHRRCCYGGGHLGYEIASSEDVNTDSRPWWTSVFFAQQRPL